MKSDHRATRRAGLTDQAYSSVLGRAASKHFMISRERLSHRSLK
jgi:hypothetical protein